MPDYAKIAKEARIATLKMIYGAQTSHIGSCFSVADILAVLFEKADLKKDKIILSCGWKAAIFYHFLAEKGFFPKEDLETFCQPGSPYIGLVETCVPGVEYSCGSMGHGLPAAVGYALSKKLKGEEGKVYCIMSDGEMAIGTTLEAALIAEHHKLDNLVVVVDVNGLQAMGETSEILDTNSFQGLHRRFNTMWWQCISIEGHNYEEIEKAIDVPHSISKEIGHGFTNERCHPKIIIALTIKGKGVSFMENQNLFHYKAPSEEEYQLALKELA